MVYIILGEGFEPAEAIVPCDILRRGGVEVQFAGIGGRLITGGHQITLQADCIVEEIRLENTDMIVLPGGLGGVRSILACPAALQLVKDCFDAGKYVAAICAAPTILASLHITDGKMATCYPGMEDQMGAALMQNVSCIQDGTVLTGRAAGASFDFGLLLLKALRSASAAQKVQSGIVYAQ